MIKRTAIRQMTPMQAAAGAAVWLMLLPGCEKPPQPVAMENPPWGGLVVNTAGVKLSEATDVVVMLHGFGGNSNDFRMLINMPSAPGTCFVFPQGPVRINDVRWAWFDRQGGFEEAWSQVLAMLNYIHDTNPKAAIILGGFSQGGMLSSNFLGDEPPPLSGVILLAPSGRTPHAPTSRTDKPSVFIAHGRSDDAASFQGSEGLRATLLDLGFEVDWVPFDGGHKIPPMVFDRIAKFITRVQTADSGGAP